MKIRLILLTIICCFFNCTVTETPEFISVNNIEVKDSNSKFIILTADALFLNPNDIGGELETEGIKVFVNDNELTSVVSKRFNVPKKDKFTIPLEAKIPTDSLFSNKNLSGLLGSLFSKNIKVQYKGDIKYNILGFSHKYTVDLTENVKIKL